MTPLQRLFHLQVLRHNQAVTMHRFAGDMNRVSYVAIAGSSILALATNEPSFLLGGVFGGAAIGGVARAFVDDFAADDELILWRHSHGVPHNVLLPRDDPVLYAAIEKKAINADEL